ncbi:MAG TPA: hypothetical protein VFD43_10450 [Planctomycetota bacterium]|nr:hypothetical protein [Planctomycetota bacterium]
MPGRCRAFLESGGWQARRGSAFRLEEKQVHNSTPMWLWVVVSAVILALVVALRVRPWARSGLGDRSIAWFLAGMLSATFLVLIAARLVELLPAATAVDAAAVAVAGLLTGSFLGFSLTRGEREPQGG